jgi:outer membrane autotransporter protein
MKKPNAFNAKKTLLGSAGLLALSCMIATMPASAVVPNDNQTPDDILDDEVDVTGVGQFFRSDGFICSGSLINPRTVLFAAHCVNDRPETDYGTSVFSAWSFRANALPGLQSWFGSGFQTDTSQFVYNVNQMIINQDSLRNPQAQGFLEADIAISSLDTPASNIPTWALLFSPLEVPTEIDPVTGTGYHVNIVGYGNTGNATQGAFQSGGFRRRAAENMLGALASFDDRDGFLFGFAPGFLPQNLYRLDFDDPNGTNPFDFNLWQDEALEREGTTGGGDSGGPLIIDAENNAGFDEDVVIGVLSGGSRFFGGQPFSSYGTESYYQPLYLYWDWIAANNPYRYVGANAGDGDWEDAAHWTSLQDPNYRVLDSNGNVVVGTPTAPGAGLTGSDPQFGSICFDPQPRGEGAFDACQDINTGEITQFSTTTTAAVVSNIGQIDVNAVTGGRQAASLTGGDNAGGAQAVSTDAITQTGADNAAQADGFSDDPLPAATIENGLVGATNFVPDNIDPDVVNAINARYFDVTLSADGTTTLSSTVEIDRLSIMGQGAGLDITSGGDLTSLIDVTQMAGMVNVDGSLTSAGDYLVVSGMLSGSGTITAPFFTNVAGAIAPGGIGTEGTLTIDGNAVLSSGSVLLIDTSIGSNDTLNVTGDLNAGGNVALSGQGVTFGDTRTIVSYGGAVSGEFTGISGLGDGVLQGRFSDSGSSIDLIVEAGSFLDVLGTSGTATQNGFGTALNDARGGNYSDMKALFDSLDRLNATDLGIALDGLAPNDAVIMGQGSLAMGDAMDRRLDLRLRDVRRGQRGFVASGSAAGATDEAALNGSSARNSFAATQLGSTAASTTTEMKEGWGGFATLDYFFGESETGFSSDNADVDGFSFAAGLDKTLSNGAVIGATLSYANSDNSLASGLGDAEIKGASFGLYGYMPLSNDFFIDGYATTGRHRINTARISQTPTTIFTSEGKTDSDVILAGANVGREFNLENGLNITPMAGLLYGSYDFDGYTETGGAAALNIAAREITTTQLSIGALVDWTMGKNDNIHPVIGASIVQDLDGDQDQVIGSFASATAGTPISFGGPDRSETWVDLEAALDMDFSDNTTGSLSIKQSVSRSDLEQTVVGAKFSVKF